MEFNDEQDSVFLFAGSRKRTSQSETTGKAAWNPSKDDQENQQKGAKQWMNQKVYK